MSALESANPDRHSQKEQDTRDVLRALLIASDSDVARIQKGGRVRKPIRFKDEKLHELEYRGGAIIAGGGGVVIQCCNLDRPDVQYALKVARPSLFAGQNEKEERRKAKAEALTHLPLAHPNVAKLYRSDVVRFPGETLLRFWLVEWIEEPEKFHRRLERLAETPNAPDSRPRALLRLLIQAFESLAYIHSRGVIHWDMKGDNLLVDAHGTVKLMDLGNAHPRHAEPYSRSDSRDSTDRNLPARLRERLSDPATSVSSGTASLNRALVPLREGEASWDLPFLDMYMLAREVDRVVGFTVQPGADGTQVTPREKARYEEVRDALRLAWASDPEDRYCAEFIGQVIKRVLAGDAPEHAGVYDTADDVVRALRRLEPEMGEAEGLPELALVPQHVLRIPPQMDVAWTTAVQALATTNAMLRLKKHRQLATVREVFPGAEHNRWEHSMGTFAHAAQYIRALYADRTHVFFRLQAARRDAKALLATALLHDVGHTALGHQLETTPAVEPKYTHEAHLKAVLETIAGLRPRAAPRRGPLEHQIRQDALEIGEVIVKHWSEGDVRPFAARMLEILRDRRDASAPHAFQSTNGKACDAVLVAILHSIISGNFDADKLDYLKRDAYHCGVSYGQGIDDHRLLLALTAITEKGTIGVTEKGILPLESVIIARYQMFAAVYWQHTVRALTALLRHVIESLACPPGAWPPAKGDGTPALNASLVEKIIVAFRDRPDDEALAWLATQTNHVRVNRRIREAIERACRGLRGVREEVPWSPVALFATQSPGESSLSADDQLYWALTKKWEQRPGEAAVEVIERRRRLRSGIQQALATAMKESGVKPWSPRYGDILLDVPEHGRDQVGDTFVERGDYQRTDVRRLAEVTPPAGAVADAFVRSARRARVFLHPSLLGAIRASGIREFRMAQIMSRALAEALGVKVQQEFQFRAS